MFSLKAASRFGVGPLNNLPLRRFGQMWSHVYSRSVAIIDSFGQGEFSIVFLLVKAELTAHNYKCME